jgi:O-antigen ligase
VLFGLLLFGGALLASQALTLTRLEHALGLVAAGAVFLLVFVRTEVGLYLALLSMLLSPEFTIGGQGALAEYRQIVLRAEDLLLLAIALSWLAKTAVNKELGVVLKTPLNGPIVAYIATQLLATLVGYLTGTVKSAAGFFYVLKYTEYFIIYYMVVNNVQDRSQAWRLIRVAFFTAVVVSLIGISQIPSGQRVSAPFEGEVGEPNTFGGYLLFTMALAAGLLLESDRVRTRTWSLGLLGLLAISFVYTFSRTSYLGVIPLVAVLALLSSRRRLMGGVLLLLLVGSPMVAYLVPTPVVKRVLYTFEPEAGQPTVSLGRIAFDPSTSARLISFRQALEGWMERPILGYGVTGFRFMDAQYPRTLVETGVVGFAAFLWLVWSVLRSGVGAFRALGDPRDRGLALGFVAGTVGLLTHALGANTFIIVRIMEPFWFFAGIVVMLRHLSGEAGKSPAEGS